MITSQQKHILRILYFQSQQQTHGLYTLMSPVNIVAEEKIVRFWRRASLLQKTEQIVILSVNVCSDGDRTSQSQEDRLTLNHLLCKLYYLIYCLSFQQDKGARIFVLCAQQLIDGLIDVEGVVLVLLIIRCKDLPIKF